MDSIPGILLRAITLLTTIRSGIGLYQKTWNNADLQWVDGTPFVINDPGWKPWSWDQPNNKGFTAVYIVPVYASFGDERPSLKYWALCEKSVSKFKTVK